MSKPMIVTLPLVLLLLDYWPLQRLKPNTLASLVREKWPFFVLSFAVCVVTFLAQREISVIRLESLPVGWRVSNAVLAYGTYLVQTVWPVDLTIFYPLQERLPGLQVALAGVVLVTVTVGCWLLRRRKPHLLVGWLWFLGTLVPVIGLVQVGQQAHADRYTYIPCIGLFLALVVEAGAWTARSRWRGWVGGAAATGILAACIVDTAFQLRFWRDSETLFRRAVAVTTENAVAHLNLGVALEEEGRNEEARREYEASLKLSPKQIHGHNDLANVLGKLGQREQALVEYREAVRLNPQAELPHLNMALQLATLRRYDEALSEFDEAGRLGPTDPRPLFAKARTLLRLGRSSEAVGCLREALRRNRSHLESTILLARVLASDPNPQVRSAAESEHLAVSLNEMTGGGNPFILDTLAMAYAEAGRFADAQQAARNALEQVTAAGNKEAIVQIQEHLRSYEASRPWRENLGESSTNSASVPQKH